MYKNERLSRVLSEQEVERVLESYATWTDGCELFDVYSATSLAHSVAAVKATKECVTLRDMAVLISMQSVVKSKIVVMHDGKALVRWDFVRMPFDAFEREWINRLDCDIRSHGVKEVFLGDIEVWVNERLL